LVGVDFSTVTNATGLLQSANTQTGGYFWFGMLFMLWIVLILAGLSFGFEISIISASFIMLIVSMLLAYGHLLAWSHVIFFLMVIMSMTIYIYYTSRNQNQ